MAHGVFVVVGVILIIASRYFYFDYELGLESSDNSLAISMGVLFDIGGTVIVVLTLLDYYSIIII